MSKPLALRNVEIKAKVKNLPHLIEKANKLSTTEYETISQHDIFFKVPEGRLKLRKFKDGSAELIHYNRPDKEGPKLSDYDKCNIDLEKVQDLVNILTRALGVLGTVKKERLLYKVGQTRVHIDAVEGLGQFMELEVTLNPEQTLEEGQKIAKDLMEKLGIKDDDLIAGAYLDLLQK